MQQTTYWSLSPAELKEVVREHFEKITGEAGQVWIEKDGIRKGEAWAKYFLEKK